jgi:DNA-binding response OmpR family regulator
VRQIRADSGLGGTRLLLLTAKAQESDVRRGIAAGADAYVSKPFSPAELSARVQELLAYDGAA